MSAHRYIAEGREGPIVGSAIRIGDTVYSVPRPGRHHHVILHMYEDLGITTYQAPNREQGFVLRDGRFVDRKEGARIALESGQIDELHWPPDLYSEDLW